MKHDHPNLWIKTENNLLQNYFKTRMDMQLSKNSGNTQIAEHFEKEKHQAMLNDSKKCQRRFPEKKAH